VRVARAFEFFSRGLAQYHAVVPPTTRRRLRGVTFDFWNTLFVPESGVPLRIEAAAQAVAGLGFAHDAEAVRIALEAAGALHTEAWRRGEQYGAPFLVAELDRRLGLNLDPTERERLQEVIEDPGPSASRRPFADVGAVLADLHERGFRLGVVSDTGWSPGRVLRRHLEAAGLLRYFEPEGLAFSNEVGVPKPDPRMFERALAGIGVDPFEAAHVGDLKFTDVAGARALGMLAIRFTGAVDDDGEGPEAEHVVGSFRELRHLLLEHA
jgi:putative hydrolase of the HAD superfamily